jgi:serine phosphatase RsbU (regulator of sigma subunit)
VAAYYLILRAVFVSSLQRPYRELNRARDDLERSFESIGVALASSLELDKTLKLIVGLASDILHSPHALVALARDDPDALEVKATRGIEDPPSLIPLHENLAARVVQNHEPVWIDEMGGRPSPYPSELSESGYLHSAVAAPILRDGTVLGVLAVYSPRPRAFDESDARLLATFARQAAVAIGNARLYEGQLDAKSQIQSHANQLAILHEIGLSLNRETNQKKLLERVLKAAAELTSAGTGIMLLIRDGRTELISQYHAPGNEGSCQVAGNLDNLHQNIARLVSKDNQDVIRLSDLSGLRQLPEGHMTLQGLIVATLRDTQGKIRGHFMLTGKADGIEFTQEDEQIISLLAAQSSVALASVENFEREHHVAESLQTALLPETPVRNDVEVGLLYRSAGPYGRVGGDFYDFVELDDHRIAVAVGDVCGKGLEAAKYTAMIKYMLRAYLGEGMFPGDCLTRLNRAVNEQLSIEKFVTMALAVIDTRMGTVTYASAGHPPAFICKGGQAHPMATPRAVPLGVLPEQTYLSSQTPLIGACAIIMFTDGLIEARPEDGEPFGEQRVTEAMAGRCRQPAQQAAEELLAAAVEYSGDNLRDDIALLVVRLLEKSPASSCS